MIKLALPRNIRAKIMMITAAVTLIIASITVTVCFLVFQSFLRKAEIQSAEFNLQVISNNVSDEMDSILDFNQWCGISTDVSRYMEAFRNQNRMPTIPDDTAALRSLAMAAYNRLKEEYNNTHARDYIARVIVSPANRRNYMQITDTYASNTSGSLDMLCDSSLFKSLISAPGYFWDGFQVDPLMMSGSQKFLPIARPIYSQYNADMVGWTYITVTDRLIADYLKSFPLESDSFLYVTIGRHTYLYQDGGFTETPAPYQVLSQIRGQTINDKSQALRVRLPGGKRRTVVSCPLGDHGWTVAQVLSEQGYLAQRRVYSFIIIGIVAFIALVGVLLYILLNRIISRPVQKLQSAIGRISGGDFSSDPTIEWPDEFGDIGRGINRMSGDVSTLMDKRVEDEKQKKDLEYQILQSQINPHFLYNTLNSIKWMATIQGATGIGEMTTALARLMKNVSKGTSALIPLREELDLVKDYFLIQQYRYGGSLSIDYQIADERLCDCLIHRFTLQPIVENALFHGIEPKGCAGKIVIRAEEAYPEEDRHVLVVSVTDNGVGMSQETIQKVLAGDEKPTADFFRQVGINNVNKRIRYDFGDAYGITIESVPGEYTTMKITLPYRTAQGEEL